MIRNGILVLLAIFAVSNARAEDVWSPARCKLPCILETLWDNIEALEDKDRRRLEPLFLQSIATTGDVELIHDWEDRLGTTAKLPPPYENYALSKVSAFIKAEGWDAFFMRARSKQRPFNTGRPEMMAAAAEFLADEETAKKILSLMERLADADNSQAAFERSSFGHALAEAAMRRCDLDGFDRALKYTDEPGALRYAVWRTRMAGDLGDVIQRLQKSVENERAMHVRQTIDGLTDVLALKICEVRP